VILFLPSPGDCFVDVWMETLVDRAGQGDGFEETAFGVIRRQWDGDVNGKADDAAGHVFAHVFFHAHRHASDKKVLLFGLDADDGGHAGGEGGGDEVGGGKRLAPAVVIDRGVRVKFDARGAVGGPAAQVSFVLNLDGDHSGVVSYSTVMMPFMSMPWPGKVQR
jgi:hypothetical protein